MLQRPFKAALSASIFGLPMKTTSNNSMFGFINKTTRMPRNTCPSITVLHHGKSMLGQMRRRRPRRSDVDVIAQVGAPHLFVLRYDLRRPVALHRPITDDVTAIHDVQDFASRVVGDENRDPPLVAVRRAVRLANLCLTLDRIPPARAGYQKVLEVEPEDPEALFNLGMCELREGNIDRARALWEAGLKRVGRDSRGLFREALERWEETVDGAPDGVSPRTP